MDAPLVGKVVKSAIHLANMVNKGRAIASRESMYDDATFDYLVLATNGQKYWVPDWALTELPKKARGRS